VKILVRTSLILTLLLLMMNAYVRMDAFGIGCQDWPSCYGMIANGPDISADDPAAQLTPSGFSMRVLTFALGFCILLLGALALRSKWNLGICITLAGVATLLIWTGFHSAGAFNPVMVMANLIGGFTALGLLAWLEFRQEPGSPNYTQTRIQHIRPLVLIALFLVSLQVILGGLTSVNFAARSCPSLPDCEGVWFPDATIFSALKLTGPVSTTNGVVTTGLEQIAIHIAHRWGAILSLIAILVAGLTAIQGTSETRKFAYLALIVLLIEFALGIVSVIVAIPITLAVAHNALAALLLLTLMKLLALSEVRWVPD
jgi:cytochrome c oxidase assembly protein subunit 15